jgi:phage shock protein A
MLNEIRRIFRRSVDAFRSEVSTREPEDQIAELLSAMRRELVAARAAVPEYEEELRRAQRELAREEEALAQCERRGELAARIGDQETVQIAAEFAGKHRTRIEVLRQKVAASEAELNLRRSEADEMRDRYKEAEANRFALLAQLRMAGAQQRMRSAATGEQGPMADWARMQDRVEHDVRKADAYEELSEEPPPTSGGRVDPRAVEDRLRELKRQMGRE